MSSPLRILCLGGGYAAIGLARTLHPAIRRGEAELTVVSRDNFHAFHGFVAEMIGGKVQPGQIASPARRIFPPAHFHNAEIERIDLDTRTVTTSRILDGKEYELTADHLVIALGALDDVSLYPGLAEHAMTLRNYWNDFKMRNHLISMLEMADIEPDPEERRRLLTFVVAGGNFGGIEIVTEIRDLLDDTIGREYARIRRDEVRVVLVHSGTRIFPELLERQPRLVDYAERVLAGREIVMRLGTRLTAATQEEAILNTGERIPTRTIISCTGAAQPPVLARLEAERDDRGRLVTDEHLRLAGRTNIWAAGDCAAVPHPRGASCPQLAIYALTQGRRIGGNLRRAIGGRPPKPYRFTGLGDACSIGNRKAVADVKGFRLSGFPAWLLWRCFLLRDVPTWDRKVRMMVDWLVWPFIGREIVNMQVREPFGLRRKFFDVGQEIVRQGEIGRELYLIWNGEVEVVEAGDGGQNVVATLREGQHFGEIAVFEGVRRTATVRARTPVELLAIGRGEALALSAANVPFADSVQRLPVQHDEATSC